VTLLTACGALGLLPLLLLCSRQQARRDLGSQTGLLVVTLLTACGALGLLPLLLLCSRQQARRDLGSQTGLLVVTEGLAEGALMHRVNRVRSTDSIV
jgi:hypothetical protein